MSCLPLKRPEKPRQSSAATTWGSENDSGTCRTRSRPGPGASPDGGLATSARLVLVLTSSGSSINLQVQGACTQFRARREERGARNERLHLMEKS